MKKLKKLISLVVCAIMLINFLPQIVLAVNNDNGTCTISTGTIYVLVEEKTVNFTIPNFDQTQNNPDRGKTTQVKVPDLKNGGKYLIVATNGTGYQQAARDDNGLKNTQVQVNPADASVPRQYISNRGNATVWTATKVDNSANSHDANRQENDWRFSSSNNRYLNGNGINNSGTQMSVRDHYLSWYYAQTFLRYNDGWTSTSSSYPYGPPPSNATQIYFYEETSVTSTYSISANDLHLSVGETFNTNNIVKQLKVNGNNINDNSFTNGRYSYEVIAGSDVLGLSNDGTLTAKKSGVATVRVTYSWGPDNDKNIVWTDIEVIVGVPHYEVDILEGGASKSIIAKKNVSNGDTMDLSAVVFSGSFIETDAVVSWAATNASIGTVTQNDDGTATFTFNGDEGSTVLLATYTYVNEDGKNITVTDQVTITASKSDTIFPSDGTDDFPEFPDEGSVRLDKTGTAVGNFNQTGLVEVELSMTGVPFKTNAGLDVVLMLDESNSMTQERLNATKAATKLFLKSLIFNDDGSFTGNRIFVGSFQGGNPDPQYAGQDRHTFRINYITNNGQNYQVVTSQEEYNALIAEVDRVLAKESNNEAPYGTEYAKSLQFCYDMLNKSKADGNKQFCVFMSDGIPNVYHGENGAVVESSSAMANMFRGTNYNTRDTDYQYEKYSTAMKNNGVTVFSVGLGLKNTNSSLGNATAEQCEHVANILLNDISGPAYEPTANRDTGSNVSKLNEYFFSVQDADAASGMSSVFETIAQKILDAARDVKVTDQITDDYTMVFEPPSDYINGALGTNAEKKFYIDVLNYELIPQYENGQIVDYNRSGTPTEVMKLYMGKDTNGNYYAAKEDGTAYDAPQFAQTPLGSKYYWTTTDITGSKSYSGVSVTAGGKTYYFDTNGVYADSGANLSTWYNMVSGAYAFGTPEHIEGSSDNKDATVYRNLVIATPYFVYNASTRQLLWTLDKLDNKEIALRYFLYLERAAVGTDEPLPGTYPTNVEATLAYTNFQNNKVQQWYPEPKMTWHGAQVTYVFYLVNEQGQPVNRAGRVIPFSEAVYVTDQHTINVIWTGLEKQKSLGANLLAQDIVPSVYQLYDTTAAYSVHAFENETAMKQNNHFRIEGTTGTTYVFNSKSDTTKYHTSGIYAEHTQIMCKDYNGVTKDGNEWSYTGGGTQYKENGNPIYGTDDTGDYTIVYENSNYQVEEGFNFYDTTVAFAVKWIPSLAPDEVVIDYGLDVLVDITTNDLCVAEPIGLMAVAPSGVTENTGHILDLDRSNVYQSLEFKNGNQLLATASLEGYNVRFHLDRNNGMQLTNDFTFYYVSEVSYYSNNVLMKEYMYTHVRIIPATTMYYEEDFVTASDWSTLGSPSSSVQDVDRPGFNRISEANDANNVYGYDGHYKSCPNYSLNSTKLGEVGDTATFTFNGTGYDLIGRTDQQTACILVSMTQAGSTGKYPFTGTFVRDGEKVTATGDTIFVDTYYESNNGVAAIPQVPVITVRDLPYGTYTVTVEVVRTQEAESDFYHEGTDRFYFDALRIYDPIGIRSYSDSVGAVYVMDNEWSPDYEEFRNEILKVYGDTAFEEEITFIDRNGNISDIALYNIWGPNNEFYLAPGETIRLNVDPTYLKSVLNNANSRGMADMQLGIKLVSGGSSEVTISNAANSRSYSITSTSDLNFSIKDMYNGTLVIKNTGGGVVSLNTMKVTLLPPQTTATFALRRTADPGVSNQPAYLEEPTNQTTEMPASPNSVISGAILNFKETFASVIIAVASAMDGFSKWLQDVANALFS